MDSLNSKLINSTAKVVALRLDVEDIQMSSSSAGTALKNMIADLVRYRAQNSELMQL